MKLNQLLKEKPVESTWITNITFNRARRILTMMLSSGSAYSIPGITRGIFDKWVSAESKGRFFHKYIKPSFNIMRIR